MTGVPFPFPARLPADRIAIGDIALAACVAGAAGRSS